MTQTAPQTATRASAGVSSHTPVLTRVLIGLGCAAGPLFVAAGLIQAVTRPGFVLAKHPLSLLSVGGLGWIQIANFVLAGTMFLASAFGIRRALPRGRASAWGPILIATFGVALIAGGVFVADPALGFPAGTPEGIPERFTWHGTIHAFAPVLGFLALSAACFVFARRSFGLRERAWAWFSIVTGVAVQVLGAVPNATMNFIPLWAAVVLGFGWASAQLARLLPHT